MQIGLGLNIVNHKAKPSVPQDTTSALLLEDGVFKLLLEDGSSYLLLEG